MSADRICPLTGEPCLCISPFERSCKEHAKGYGRFLASLSTADISSARKESSAKDAWEQMVALPVRLAVGKGAEISEDMSKQMQSWAFEERDKILSL